MWSAASAWRGIDTLFVVRCSCCVVGCMAQQAGAAAAVENVLHRWLDSLFVGWLKPDLLLRAMDGCATRNEIRACVSGWCGVAVLAVDVVASWSACGLFLMYRFMNEGPKVLLRLCVAITKSFESAIVKCNTADEVRCRRGMLDCRFCDVVETKRCCR